MLKSTTLSSIRHFRNKFGSVSLERRDRIVVACFSGSINAGTLAFFSEHLEPVVGELKGRSWCYLSSSSEAMVGTQEAETLLMEAGRLGHQWGCVQAAYVLKSPVAIAQTRRIREKIGVEQPLDEVLFDTEAQAVEYLNHYLDNLAE